MIAQPPARTGADESVHRPRRAHRAITFFVATSLAIALDAFTGHRLGVVPVWLASGGVLCMFSASLLLARESTLAVTAIQEEMDHRPRPRHG